MRLMCTSAGLMHSTGLNDQEGALGMPQFMKRTRMFFSEFWHADSGVALVEAGIVLPVFLIVLAGGVELGRAISYHHTADKALRDSARFIARLPTDVAYDTARAQNLVAYGSWSPSGTPPSRLYPGVLTQLRFDQARFNAGFVRLEADVTYTFPMLSVILGNDGLTVTVTHEQPHIGE
jgi:Flp pilus assembly protein TadG